MILVTLIYQDGSTWFAGSFSTIEDANKWIAEEKTRTYWQTSTQIQIEQVVNDN